MQKIMEKNCVRFQRLCKYQIQIIDLVYLILFTSMKKKEKKENITFIVPLGANLKKSLTLVFDDKETTDIAWAKCESFGCIGLQTNNSSDKNEIDQFNKIKSLLQKSKKIEMRIPTFTPNPILIPADLDGYDQASKKMFAEEIF